MGGADVLGVFDGGAGDGRVFGEAYLGAGFAVGADGLHSEAVGQAAEVSGLGEGFLRELEAGGVEAVAVAELDEGADLVGGHEVADAVGEVLGYVAGVGCVGLGGLALLPAASVFEGLGQVPVEEGAEGLDSGGEEGVYEAVVEVEAFGVRGAGAGGEDAGPGYGEAEGFEA